MIAVTMMNGMCVKNAMEMSVKIPETDYCLLVPEGHKLAEMHGKTLTVQIEPFVDEPKYFETKQLRDFANTLPETITKKEINPISKYWMWL